MGRLAIKDIIAQKNLCCPRCHNNLVNENDAADTVIACASCGETFNVYEDIPLMLLKNPAEGSTKKSIQAFWKELYDACYSEKNQGLDKNQFLSLLEDVDELFRHRRHLAVTEMPVGSLTDKKVLEIGSGNGVHSAYFSSLGARMYSMDITFERVAATAQKLDFVSGHDSVCLQGDAETLPFPDGFFDIVYSNGVLHHTSRTDKAVDEIYRVLKPGGIAVIMLYAKHSFRYWVVLFLLNGILQGNIRRDMNWLGKATEWMSKKEQNVYNPITKVYARKDIHQLFGQFDRISIRKNSFEFQQIPKIGKIISKILTARYGLSSGGILLYGEPWRKESALELWLGQYIGFGLNILATK